MSRITETQYFFFLSSNLSVAKRTGTRALVAEAADDLDVFAMHADCPKLAQRARAAIASLPHLAA